MKTEEEIKGIEAGGKIEKDIKKGICFLEIAGECVGLARFSDGTRNFIEITVVYVKKEHRKKGYGRMLMENMITAALDRGKIPVLQTNEDNVPARRLYERSGFEEVGDYAFWWEQHTC